ncbi:type I phosphodiesterase/nucleotide pyrophosphatase [Candidatus Omnitrophus magneticus]|uniref:Type I phosphodiesterase/nucleotide pyrophosphatase n=1 Tax=Candidatus Omnitrophus magneticus TaxID=1609969 RepID=A0A0F0CRG4_9BACT|nr:type I phosphodiesterase/nucleotide pyrophosphatase [Candidatus Omnitrophus magneticus]
MDLTFEGQKVINKVYLKGDIFHGDFVEAAPDMYLLSNYGFDLKGAVNKGDTFGASFLKGMHTYDDALFTASSRPHPAMNASVRATMQKSSYSCVFLPALILLENSSMSARG